MSDLPPLPPEPWLRLDSETEEEFAGFIQYRDQPPPRTMARVFGSRKEKQIAWYAKHRWPERCKAWDRHTDAIRMAEQEEIYKQSAKEIATEHMRLLKAVRDVAMIEAEKFASISLQSELPSVKVSELSKITEIVVKLDRLVRGEATERTETAVDLSHMSAEDLLEAEELLKKLGGA